MKSKIQKWGNSLAVRIPKAFADEMKLSENSSIQMMLQDGALHIVPEEEKEWKLDDLIARVNADNIPEEWDTGPAVGKERL
jgi:antitoxin MazE